MSIKSVPKLATRTPVAAGPQSITRVVGSSVFACVLVFGVAGAGSADDKNMRQTMLQSGTPDYKLGALDRIRIKVYSWRPSQDQIFEWSAINGEYSVGAAGNVSVPLIGELLASGKSTATLAMDVATAVQARIGMVEKPDASVEVVQFRPFYIVGDVQKPGEYPFRPGLTVLQALTLSGGFYRESRAGVRLERELISGNGDLELLTTEKLTLTARKARLDAELTSATKIRFPSSLTLASDTVAVSAITAREKLLFDGRREAYDTQVRALEQLLAYLQQEVQSVENQVKQHDKEVTLVQEELQGIKQLAEKQLVTAPRRLGLERNRAAAEGENLRMRSGVMKIRQDISKTNLALLELRSKRTNEVSAELALVDASLDQVTRKAEIAKQLLFESEVVSPLYGTGQGPEASYTIVRKSNSDSSEIEATENASIEPGDTIKVHINNIKAAPLAVATGDQQLPTLSRQEVRSPAPSSRTTMQQ